MKNKFQPITRDSNWHEYDQLDGKTLEDGEKLTIRWPDGIVEKVAVKVREGGYTISDMGHPWEVRTLKAVVEIPIHRIVVEVPMYGAKIKAYRGWED